MSNRKIRLAVVIGGLGVAAAVLIGRGVQADTPQAATAGEGAQAANVDPQTVVITVGDHKITAGQFDDFVNALPPQYQAMAKGPAKRLVAEQLIKIDLLSQAALDRKIDQTPKFKEQLALARNQILASSVADEVQSHIDDTAMKTYYEAHKADFEEVKAQHILITTTPAGPGQPAKTDEEAKAKAEAIRARLVKGEDFTKVAQAESEDPGSKANGGVYTFHHGQMVKPFEEAAFTQKIGEVGPLVKTQFGYHIIKVLERTTPKEDDPMVQAEIKQKLGPELLNQFIAGLREKAKPVMNDAFFGPEQPAAPAPAPGLPDGEE